MRWPSWAVSAALGLLVLTAARAAPPRQPAEAVASSHGLPLEGEAAEQFLRSARVLDKEAVGVGITKPVRVTLADGRRTHRAVWKTVDELRIGVHRGRQGGFQAIFRDSYRYEVAAYELDKLLSLGLVPPTIEREIEGKKGSLQLWVEGAFTELDRRERSLEPEDPGSWSDQMYKLRLLQQLVYNEDAHNIRNVIYDPSFRVYAIDHSRSFRTYHRLVDERKLLRFSRSVLERLGRLDEPLLEHKLGRWLSASERRALLARRDLIVSRTQELGAKLGEENVFYP